MTEEKNRPRISAIQTSAVTKFPGPKRYDYFIKMITDWQTVWGLYNDGWAMMTDDRGNTLIPFWPAREYAELCATKSWKEFFPREIDIEDFVRKFLPAIEIDKIEPAIFVLPNDSGVIISTKSLILDISKEKLKYQ